MQSARDIRQPASQLGLSKNPKETFRFNLCEERKKDEDNKRAVIIVALYESLFDLERECKQAERWGNLQKLAWLVTVVGK